MNEWMNELRALNVFRASLADFRNSNITPDGRTDRPSYRDAWTHLKIIYIIEYRSLGSSQHICRGPHLMSTSYVEDLTLWAPGMMPGMSAIVSVVSSVKWTTPTWGFRVVNWYGAAFGRARETPRKNVLFPRKEKSRYTGPQNNGNITPLNWLCRMYPNPGKVKI